MMVRYEFRQMQMTHRFEEEKKERKMKRYKVYLIK